MKPNSKHVAFRNDCIALLKKHCKELGGGEVSGIEALGLASHLVGQIIAMQDQRTITRELALKIVTTNIEIGNEEAIKTVFNKTEGKA